MTEKTLAEQRPLSPHLQIYRWPITMFMSITHRVTGVALSFGTIFIALWFISLAYDEKLFNIIDNLTHNLIIKSAIFLYSFALIWHAVGGIRYLLCDIKPCLLEKHISNKMSYAVIITSVVITVFIWLFSYFMA